MAVVYMAVVYVVLTVLAGYFLGCVNGALLVSKYILHDDVRDHGSGNAGLTNFHRVFGGKLTIVVVLCDMLKAVCAVLVGQLLMGHFLGLVVLGKYVAGLSCMLGHMFPCMFHFKGGKGILSGGAIALMMDWRIAVVVWGLFLVLVALTRMVSVQMGPQTRLLQNNDTQMIEKIQSSLVNTIPLWKSQMVLALGMEHSRQATAAQNAVTEMTNELLKKNADTLKMGTIATAKEAERSIVDIETLQHTNQQLISTLDEVARIQKEGAAKRKEAEAELGRIEGELKQKLLELRS